MAIIGHFGAISRPGGYKLVDQGWINLGHTHGDVLGLFPGSGMAIRGRPMVQKGVLAFLWPLDFVWLFWTMMAIPDPEKRFQHIASDVPGLDPTLIHADPPVWSRQACLWPQNDHYGIFRPF